MSKSACIFGLLVIVGLCGVGSAKAASITSAPFSFGYGYTPLATWNTTETVGLNTPTTQGNFTFTPTLTGSGFDGSGPIFTGRVLGDGSNSYSATSISYSNVPGLVASIAGAYTGPAPLDAAPVPNYQIQLNISQVSIYGANYTGFTASTLAFTESTPGHTSNSPSIALNTFAPVNAAGPYNQLVWNPTDYAENGMSSTRTFELLTERESPVDGFEVLGTVTLLYDAVIPAPEPSSILLLAMGCVGLMIRRNQSRI